VFAKFARLRFQEEFLALTERVGHRQPNPFEQKVVPQVFRGRDLVVEIPEIEDIAGAMVLSALNVDEMGSGEHVSVLLTAQPDSVKKLTQQLRVFASSSEVAVHAIGLGIDENIKKELQLLSRPPDIIVGTPERIIDHIRRENLTIANVKRILIDLPPDFADSGFDKDVLFIYSKISKRTQTVLFCSSLADGVPLSTILRRPLLLPSEVQSGPIEAPVIYQLDDEEQKPRVLGDIFYAEEVVDAAVICKSRIAVERLVTYLSSYGIVTRGLFANAQPAAYAECEAQLRAGTVRAIVTDSLQTAARVSSLTRLIVFEMPPDVSNYIELKSRASEIGTCASLLVILAKTEPDIFEGIQEVQYVDTNNRPSNEDILRGKIRSIVKQIKEEEDPDELNKLRKIVRRNVPIFLRGYFMAYLLKEAGGKQTAGGEMKTLFVSIGKNRRVFPRDLSRLFSGTLDIRSSSIGNIKVLDNYSFIDVPEPLAEKAISMLDGKDFRGRKITVNHARKKDEVS